MHVTDTKNGPKKLIDQADIDNKIANVASKQARGRILAILPKFLVEDAIQECKKTLAGNNDEPLEVRARKMTSAFARYGVKPEHLENYLGHKLDAILLDELVDLIGIFNSLKEGTPASEFFGAAEAAENGEKAAESLAAAAKAGAAAKPATAKKPAAAKPAAAQKADPKPEAEAKEPVAETGAGAGAADETGTAAEDSKDAQPDSNAMKEDSPEVNDSDATGQGENNPESPEDIF